MSDDVIQMMEHDWNSPEDEEGAIYTYTGTTDDMDWGDFVEVGQVVRLFQSGESWTVDGEVIETELSKFESVQRVRIKVDWDSRQDCPNQLRSKDQGWVRR